MCTSCYPDNFLVCPSCKRDDEGYQPGESDSPFSEIRNSRFRCRCGHIFSLGEGLGQKTGVTA